MCECYNYVAEMRIDIDRIGMKIRRACCATLKGAGGRERSRLSLVCMRVHNVTSYSQRYAPVDDAASVACSNAPGGSLLSGLENALESPSTRVVVLFCPSARPRSRTLLFASAPRRMGTARTASL